MVKRAMLHYPEFSDKVSQFTASVDKFKEERKNILAEKVSVTCLLSS